MFHCALPWPLLSYHRRCPYFNTILNQDCLGTSLEVQWLGLCTCIAGTRVQSLVGELRSHNPRDLAKKEKKKKKWPFNQLNRVWNLYIFLILLKDQEHKYIWSAIPIITYVSWWFMSFLQGKKELRYFWMVSWNYLDTIN